MPTTFQQAVKTNVSRTQRHEAIDALAREGKPTKLGILVRLSGLSGEFRGQALGELGRCRATEELEAIAEDRSVERVLRRKAAAMA